jgi:hypothetical protein
MTHAVVLIDHPSPRALSKMKKGGSTRIHPSMSGEGMSLIVSADRYNNITRAFDKGKAYTVSLTPEEISMNQSPSPEMSSQMEGKGLFDSIKKGAKKIGKALKPVVKEVLIPAGKELAKKGVRELAKMAPTAGATALSGLATLSGNPELVPFASAVGSELGKHAGSYLSGEANRRIDSFGKGLSPPSRMPVGSAKSHSVLEPMLAKATLGKAMADRHTAHYQGKFLEGQEPLHGFGLYSGSGLYGSGLYGSGLYASRTRGAGLKEKSSIGIHGNLLGHGMPPALQSQPLSANFQFASRLPPSYKSLNSGV